jgi:hypothetical protein
MTQPEWDALSGQIRDLQARVVRIEHELGLDEARIPAAAEPQAARTPLLTAMSAGAASVLVGRALLGLAAAYLLRAFTESAMLPGRIGVGVGVAYAMLWLVWAARTPAERRLETALHGLTSALVLSPLLFEAVSRFHAISSWSAAALLVAFAVVGLCVSWRKDLLVVATFATLAGVGTAAALLIATHDALPFTFAFLAIAAAVEVSACLNHWLSERWLTAAAADLAVLFTTWLVTNARGVPEAYVPIPHAGLYAAQAALLAIYLASIIVRTLLRGYTVTIFEAAQCSVVFAIGVGGGLRFSILICAAACYLVAFRVLDRDGQRGRNFYAYSTFGILLVIAGSRIVLQGDVAAMLWAGLALAAAWAGSQFGRKTLEVHGAIYLLLAVVGSGAIQQSIALLMGRAGATPDSEWPVWMSGAVAAACYYLSRNVRIVHAAAAVWLIAGILAGQITIAYHAICGAGASHAYCATIRTAMIAAAALLAAWVGARWSKQEFSRLIYPLMILGAWRLVTVDLRQERTAALFLSLLLYGGALMVLPRISRPAPTTG